jgi:hypothetical protein
MAGLSRDSPNLPAEDLEDQWLYGAGGGAPSQDQAEITGSEPQGNASFGHPAQTNEYLEESTPANLPLHESVGESSSDSDSDDVQIHIGEIRTTPFQQ